MNNTITIGMDLGDKFHMAVVFDNDGKELKIGTLKLLSIMVSTQNLHISCKRLVEIFWRWLIKEPLFAKSKPSLSNH